MPKSKNMAPPLDAIGQAVTAGDFAVLIGSRILSQHLAGKIMVEVEKLRWSESRQLWRAYFAIMKNGDPVGLGKCNLKSLRRLDTDNVTNPGSWATIADTCGWKPEAAA